MIVDPELDIQYGTKIGRFVVVGELGRGGMGVVYSAHDRELDRKVALKVLRAAEATEEERMRLLREGQAMARITHPNVITVYEVGVQGNIVFLAQELLDGGTLGKWLSTPRPQAEIVDKLVAAGRGLAAAHAAGLVHRDFKPDNVLLGKDGRVRVSDFGLARALAPGEEDLPSATRANMARAQLELARSPMSPLTRTGAVMGTPMFMAPEQHLGERADERSDQFSFAVALYHALYGDWPFAGKTAVALADNVIGGRMQPPPRGSQVSARLRQILVRALAKEPADRYPSMDALLADLTRPPGRGMRKLAFAVVAATLAGGAVVGGYVLRERGDKRDLPPIDPQTLNKGLDWLTEAVERGHLADAAQKYEMAGALELQRGRAAQASIAWASGALVLELRGELTKARAQLQQAEANAGSDPNAVAYADMAAAAIAVAGGDLKTALARSNSCATALAGNVPLFGAMCLELHGHAAADSGDISAARGAFGDALAIAKQQHNDARTLMLQLAVAELDLDDPGKQDKVWEDAEAIQKQAAEREAASVEARAWVLMARAHVAQAATQQALDEVHHVKPEKIEAIDVLVRYHLASGEVQGLLGDPEEARKEYDEARATAEKEGYVGLVLAARLARLEVDIANGAPEAKNDQRELVDEANRRGYKRIARLAETVGER